MPLMAMSKAPAERSAERVDQVVGMKVAAGAGVRGKRAAERALARVMSAPM